MIKQRGSTLLHFLDRYAGIPVIAALGSMKAKRRLPSHIQKIGLLRTVAIGDTVLLSAVVADLRRAFPKASLIFFAGPSNFEIACMLDGVDKVVLVPTGNPAAGIRAVRSDPVDAMLDFGPWPRLDALLVLFSGAAFTAGFFTFGQHRHYAYDMTVEHSPKRHELENYRSLVRLLGIEAKSPPFLRIPNGVAPFVQNQVVFHFWPGGRLSQLKQWPLKNWLRLINDLGCCGVNVVLTGAPEDRAPNDALIAQVGPSLRDRVTNEAGISLQKTAEILSQARLLVSVNTGVMHMAAALGVPLVALHGPTSARRWGPVSDKAIVIESSLAGCGYLNLGWERPPRPLACMEAIPYEAVRNACRTILDAESAGASIAMQRKLPEPIENAVPR